MRRLLLSVAVLGSLGGLSQAAWALDADQVRGGWETAADSGAHILEFSIRGTHLAGVYCTVCDDATTLARVEGTIEAHQLSFVIEHVRDDGSIAARDQASAHIEGDHLVVDGRAGVRGAPFHWIMRKDQRGPAPFGGVKVAEALPQPGAPAVNVAAYGAHGQALPPGGVQVVRAPWTQPGPWEPLSAAKLAGVWLTGSGPGKQYFIIRRAGDQLFGLVCGPCDNAYDMAALTNFSIVGDTLHFNIAHEDNGIGSLPFYNQITAHLTRNELRLVSIVPDNQPAGPRPAGGISLLGPLPYEATAGG
ncbi:MAG TPA: hypothetical protein VID71_05850 [Steroidobacteraceae bacterium]|jgi:hypothetical protein